MRQLRLLVSIGCNLAGISSKPARAEDEANSRRQNNRSHTRGDHIRLRWFSRSFTAATPEPLALPPGSDAFRRCVGFAEAGCVTRATGTRQRRVLLTANRCG